MKRTQRPVATAIAVSGAMVLAGGVASGHPSTPTRVTTIVGDAPSTEGAEVHVLAGSADRLVYSSMAVFTTTTTSGEINEQPDRQVIVRSDSGSQRVLSGLRGGVSDYASFSLSGQTLTAMRDDPGGHVNNRRVIVWWNLASKHHGVITLPRRTDYLTAAPKGVAYINRHGVVLEARSGGGTKRLGKPFSSEPRGYFDNSNPHATTFAGADDRGIVMGDDDGHARYIAFADPGTVIDLATDGSELQGCQAVNHRYAACLGSTGDEEGYASVTITSLNGKDATTFAGPDPVDATNDDGSGVALSGSTVLWTHARATPTADSIVRFVSMSAGNPTPTVGSDQLGELGITSAYGEAVTESPDYTGLISATSADATSTLLASPRSPASASAFSLSAGRLADVDDALEPATAGPVAVRLRTLATIEGRVSGGAPTTIAAPSDAGSGLVADRVATSPTATAYVSTSNGAPTVHVADAAGDEAIGRTSSAGVLAFSGNRLLYVGPGPDNESELTVHDLVTGADTPVAERGHPNYTAAAIYGHSVSYMTNDGSVFQSDLKTGKQIRVVKTTGAGRQVGNPRVYAYGGWVGWSYRTSREGRTHQVDMIRDISSRSAPIHLTQSLVGLGPDGALLANTAAVVPPDFSGRFIGKPAVISLRTWSGHTRVITSKRAYVVVPQLVGNILAWINGNGALQATVVKAPKVFPNYLGDASAPTTYSKTDEAGWLLAAPYSLPLTRCSVTISRAGAVVRTLSCGRAVAQGLAAVSWDGNGGNGAPVPAGSYRWTIHAQGIDGAARLESGARGDVTGTVVVS